MTAPTGSVTPPETVADCSCARALPSAKKKTKHAMKQHGSRRLTSDCRHQRGLPWEKRIDGLLSRLAREAGFAAYPGSIPAFAVAGSVGLLAWRTSAARPSRPGSGQWRARKISALQSRGGDGFTPSSRHGVQSRTDFQSVGFHKSLAETSVVSLPNASV